MGQGWIGVDLDGTLAEYHGWKGAEHIGQPRLDALEHQGDRFGKRWRDLVRPTGK